MSILLLGGFAVLALEGALLLFAPTLLASLAPISLGLERRLSLRRPKKVEIDDAGYRDAPIVTPPIVAPSIDLGRVDLDDAVLVQVRGRNRFALRRAFAFGRRRPYYLVRIDGTLEGDELVFRASQAIVPMTLPVVALAIGLDTGVWSVAVMFFAVSVVVFGAQALAVSGARDVAIGEALDLIEREVHRLGALKRKKKKRRLSRGAEPPGS
jgi:hypothetical protein